MLAPGALDCQSNLILMAGRGAPTPEVVVYLVVLVRWLIGRIFLEGPRGIAKDGRVWSALVPTVVGVLLFVVVK